MKKRGAICKAAIFVLLCVFFMCSCDRGGGIDYFAYTNSKFSVEIEGNIDNTAFSANAYYNPNAADGEVLACIEYSAPQSLAGIVVNLYPDGSTSARLGEIVISGTDVTAMLEPVFIIVPKGNYSEIKKDGEDNILCKFSFSDGELVYTFDKGFKYPKKIEGRKREQGYLIKINSFAQK